MRELVHRIYKFGKYCCKNFTIKYVDRIEKEMQNCNTVLDLGCGSDSIIGKFKKRKNYSVGVDIFKEYIEESKRKKIHDKYLQMNILDIDQKISSKSFDCVLLLDVMEHLDKLSGLALISKAQQIAKKKVIISTPNGFIPQQKYHKNIYQLHKSGWDISIMKKLGFHVYGILGLKFIKGERGLIKFKPIKFWRLILTVSNLFIKYFPQMAYELLCIKDKLDNYFLE